jgi:hypothetical protein
MYIIKAEVLQHNYIITFQTTKDIQAASSSTQPDHCATSSFYHVHPPSLNTTFVRRFEQVGNLASAYPCLKPLHDTH